jgi:uncharacterized protein YggE
MKSAIAATMAVAAGLVVVNMLGVAAAEAPTTPTPTRTVSVDGVASLPLAQGANRAVATAVYREAMAAAVSDGQSKAEFLAGKVGATLGSVQSVSEGSGSIECKGEESNYVEYDGEQADFGTPQSNARIIAAPVARANVAPQVRKAPPKPKKRKKKKPSAKAATATASVNASCTLSTDVSLVYPIS